eukprot:scaffold18861_cov26-Tisochrysis_lutea.AAC.5
MAGVHMSQAGPLASANCAASLGTASSLFTMSSPPRRNAPRKPIQRLIIRRIGTPAARPPALADALHFIGRPMSPVGVRACARGAGRAEKRREKHVSHTRRRHRAPLGRRSEQCLPERPQVEEMSRQLRQHCRGTPEDLGPGMLWPVGPDVNNLARVDPDHLGLAFPFLLPIVQMYEQSSRWRGRPAFKAAQPEPVRVPHFDDRARCER